MRRGGAKEERKARRAQQRVAGGRATRASASTVAKLGTRPGSVEAFRSRRSPPRPPLRGGVAEGAEEECDVAWSISAIDDHTEWKMVPNKVKATPVAALQRVVAPVRANRWAPMKVNISNRFGTLEEEAQFPALKASKARLPSVQMEGVRSKDKPNGGGGHATPHFRSRRGLPPHACQRSGRREPSSCWTGASAAPCPRSPRRRRRSR